jgi:DNA invertase Pin-like site-specific DNA recombinase
MDLVAYLRVSSKGQATDGYGLDVQEEQCRAWAKTHKHRISLVCTDMCSGKIPAGERPGLTSALEALRPPPQATGLIVARLDRLARVLHIQETALIAAWQAGGTVFSVDQGEVLEDDPDDPMRTFVRQVMGGVAQLDRAMVVKRMKDGKRAKAASGRHAEGEYPFGYRGEGSGKTRDKVPDEDEQKAVRRIVELRQAGGSYRAIAATLDAEGFKPRRAPRWYPMSVRAIAEREMATSE